MEEHGFDVTNRVESVRVRCDEQRREDVGDGGTERVSEEEAGLTLAYEGLQHTFGEVVAHGCIFRVAKRDEAIEVVQKVVVGLAKGAVGFDDLVLEVEPSAFCHAFHDGKGVLAVIVEPLGCCELLGSAVGIVAEDLGVGLFEEGGRVGKRRFEFSEFTNDVAVSIGHDGVAGRSLGQVGGVGVG